jgi:membrane-bound metal-dependent hydrolase YbcI (DUF457 family)
VAFWFAGLAFVLVWAVFKDPAIDYRLVVLGALLPDLVDGPLFGGARYLHTLAFSVVLLVVVMLATRGRRGLRRRSLAVPIGTLCHLVLDGMWARTTTFWWPFFGWRFPSGSGLPSFSRPWGLVVAQEAVGLVALAWCWRRFGLATSAARRSAFLRTGRLGREFRPPSVAA